MDVPDRDLWTSAQVDNVAGYQHSGFMHPYTCGGGGGPCSGVTMVASPGGLRCPTCGRVQTWVHDVVLSGEWREAYQQLTRALEGRGCGALD